MYCGSLADVNVIHSSQHVSSTCSM